MKVTKEKRADDIRVEDGNIAIHQTDTGNFFVRLSNSFSQGLIVNRKELEALTRAAIFIKNEVDGKNK